MFSRFHSFANIVFFLVSAVLLFWAWRDTAAHLANLVWTVDSYSHGVLIPFISIYLIWARIRGGAWSTGHIWMPALVLLSAAAGLWLIAQAADVKLFGHIALVTAFQSLILLFFGPVFYKRILFPALFIFLVIPFGEGLIPILQVITAKLAIGTLGLLGVEYQAEGVLITLSSGIFEVARACAGIKFMFTSIVTGVLLAHLIYNGWKKRLVLLLFSVLLPIVANALRVVGILLLAETYDPDFAKGVDHVVYGWGFLSFILVILIATAYKFADPVRNENEFVQHAGSNPELSLKVFAAGAVSLALPALVSMMAPADKAKDWDVPHVSAPECDNCGLRLISSDDEKGSAMFPGSDAGYSFKYRSSASTLEISGALFCTQRPGHKINPSEKYLAPPDWQKLTGAQDKILEAGDWKLRGLTHRRGKHRMQSYVMYVVSDVEVLSIRQLTLQTATSRLKHKVAPAQAIVIQGMPTVGPEDAALDDAKIRKFLSTFAKDRFLWSLQSTAKGSLKQCAE
jgi:exosortase A